LDLINVVALRNTVCLFYIANFQNELTLCGVARKKSITRTGQDNKKSQKHNISHILGKAPRKDIAMKFGTGVDVLEVVTLAEFDLENLRGVNFTGG